MTAITDGEYECIVMAVADAILYHFGKGSGGSELVHQMASIAACGDVDVLSFVNDVHKRIHDGVPFIQEPTIR